MVLYYLFYKEEKVVGWLETAVPSVAPGAMAVTRAVFEAAGGWPKETEDEAQVATLKAQLDATDYIAIKYAEGWITAEEYAPTKAQRQSWRDEINELECETDDSQTVSPEPVEI